MTTPTTTFVETEDPADPPPREIIPEPTAPAASPWIERGRAAARWLLACAGALVIFGAFLVAKGANPLDAYRAMWDSIAGSSNSIGELLVQATPFLLAGLAVAVPARAGLFNIGGQGQLVLGGIGAVWAANLLGHNQADMPTLIVMALGGAIFGGLWASIPALLKLFTFTSEAITSLLLNYVSLLLLEWLVHGPWKDPKSLGFPQSTALHANEKLPIIWGNRVHAGIFVAVVAAVVVWAVLRFTPFGFRLRVVGGNAEAARRAGFRVAAIMVSAMLIGGALAGLGGMVDVAGVQGRVRPGMMDGYGYIGFLASWLVRHDPLKILGSALLLGAIAVGGNGLKLSTGLSGSAVNILMSVLLLAILGWGQRGKAVV
ncbi:MAG: ABC transporter permease [Acidimicrobiales bacterium]